MPVIAEGVDFSGRRPSATALRAAGKSFVVRYVSAGQHGKEITPTEARYWSGEGIDVAIVYESTAGRALEGRAAGVADARAGRDNVIAAGGPASGGVIYFAVDVDLTAPAQMVAAAQYLTGAASVLGWDQVGVYGEYDLIAYLSTHTECRWFWQTYAWSGGHLHPAAQLYQHRNGQVLDGVEVDLNRAYAANFGQWPTTREDELSAADVAAITGRLDQIEAQQKRISDYLGVLTVGDSADDAKDKGTHPNNLQQVRREQAAGFAAIAAAIKQAGGTGAIGAIDYDRVRAEAEAAVRAVAADAAA
jgi:hypothetical protein